MDIRGIMRSVIALAMVEHEVALDQFMEGRRGAIEGVLSIVHPNFAWGNVMINSLVSPIDKIDVERVANPLTVYQVDREIRNAPEQA